MTTSRSRMFRTKRNYNLTLKYAKNPIKYICRHLKRSWNLGKFVKICEAKVCKSSLVNLHCQGTVLHTMYMRLIYSINIFMLDAEKPSIQYSAIQYINIFNFKERIQFETSETGVLLDSNSHSNWNMPMSETSELAQADIKQLWVLQLYKGKCMNMDDLLNGKRQGSWAKKC